MIDAGGLSPLERGHLAAALRDRGRELRRNGSELPPRLSSLADSLWRALAVSGGQYLPPAAAPADDGSLLLLPPEAARLLQISVRTLRRLAASGSLPSVQLGGRRRYRRSDLEQYIAGLPAGKRMGELNGLPARPDPG